MRILNASPAIGKSKLNAMFAFRNEAKTDEPLEILVYEDIGKDPWTGEGFGAKDLAEKLAGIPKTREITLRVNSRGGYVFEGLPVYNLIKQWPAKTVGIVDGVAASIASVLLMGCKEVQMPKSSQMFIHDAWASMFMEGDSEEIGEQCEKLCAQLDTTSDMIAGIYADKTGMDKEMCREMMRETTLMNGEQCLAKKFCDKLTDASPVYNFSPEDLSAIRNLSKGGKQGGQPPQPKDRMDRNEIIALLKAQGHAVDEKATDKQLMELLTKSVQKPQADNTVIVDLKNALKAITDQSNKERKDRIERAVDAAIASDRITLEQKAKWIDRITKDETALEILNELPQRPPGAAPMKVLETGAAAETVLNHMASLSKDNRNALKRGQVYEANRDKVIGFLNAAGDNTIAAGVQRQAILQEGVRAFALVIAPLRAFASVYNSVPLEGTDKIDVPYYDLESTASTDFNAANGYVIGTTTTDAREITINKRKYQAFSFSSSLAARQPFYNRAKLLEIKMEKLGVDVFQDVLSVVTLANYGAAAVTTPAAGFDGNYVTDLRGACNTANWPTVGRSLILDSEYDSALFKDQRIAYAQNFGSAAPIQDGALAKVLGFDYFQTPNIPANAQNLKGFAVFQSAILMAFSPIQPAPAVMKQLATYEVYTEPKSGATIEYREYGSAQMDVEAHTVESNYGYVKGNGSALKRVVSA